MQDDPRLGTPHFRAYLQSLPPEKQIRIVEQSKRHDGFRRHCETLGKNIIAAEAKRRQRDADDAVAAVERAKPDPEIAARDRADRLIQAAMEKADRRIAESAAHNTEPSERILEWDTPWYDRFGRIVRVTHHQRRIR